jgi:hypothetical protein
MTKPDITLEPSKGVISEMAARIYSAYIVRGEVRDGEETKWMERSIREAVRIAKTVEASIETDDAPAGAEDSPTLGGEKPAPRASATAARDSRPAPSGEGSAEHSELDGVIDEALSGKEVPTRKSKD